MPEMWDADLPTTTPTTPTTSTTRTTNITPGTTRRTTTRPTSNTTTGTTKPTISTTAIAAIFSPSAPSFSSPPSPPPSPFPTSHTSSSTTNRKPRSGLALIGDGSSAMDEVLRTIVAHFAILIRAQLLTHLVRPFALFTLSERPSDPTTAGVNLAVIEAPQ
ncbi:uncharacterized protein BO80DRAFT_443421 [Aspergillus ibericus CBS 121593]|uniref:Uncharacterized protein n=1 Tax=Aspergillus ibericus CBS 121593 TaxID=1448316 RepID=A0A395H4P6_9EURO|nr:hypothetical protein BO80DRAFT_443421 [Aspergillus ibericus CBS 121593]RAL02620.1 hypothetical protein BO80DRAFT_443421 [Aspergillus ibericus CBS 121593]